MRDDFARIFEQASRLEARIRSEKGTEEEVLLLANLKLQLGRPDQAINHILALCNGVSDESVLAREALWLAALANCLRAAIAEGDAAGSSGLAMGVDHGEGFRKAAMATLEAIDHREPDEEALLRKLKRGGDLSFIQDYICGRITRIV